MSKYNKIIPYEPHLKSLARELRKNSTLSEVLLYIRIKNKALGVEFHRQVPMLGFIVDFYCHELMLAIEIDGDSHIGKEMDDIFRQKELENWGIKFIRFEDIEVKKNMETVIKEISNTIIEMKKTE